MKKPDLGQIISVLANLGVIAGIVFLALELRQNNELMETEARAATNDRLREVARVAFTDQSLADLLVRAKNGESLTESEDARVLAFSVWRLRGLQSFYRNVEAGTIESIPIEGWRDNFDAALWAAPPLSEQWDRASEYLNDDFVQYMEENVVNER